MNAVFIQELDTAPLALLLWIAGIGMVVFPTIVSEKTVAIWSWLAIIVTGLLAWQVNGYEYLLPLDVKVAMVAAILFLLALDMVLVFLSARKPDELDQKA